MFPPLTIATIGPEILTARSTAPVRMAAVAAAPLGSATMPV